MGVTFTVGLEEVEDDRLVGGGNTLVETGREGGVCGPGGISPKPRACCIVKDCDCPSGAGIEMALGGLGNEAEGGILPAKAKGREDSPKVKGLSPLARRSGEGFHPLEVG
jgi:hypothetical protein